MEATAEDGASEKVKRKLLTPVLNPGEPKATIAHIAACWAVIIT
jgi:hypothetical protein